MRSILSLFIGVVVAALSASLLLRAFRADHWHWHQAFGAALFLGVAVAVVLAVLRGR